MRRGFTFIHWWSRNKGIYQACHTLTQTIQIYSGLELWILYLYIALSTGVGQWHNRQGGQGGRVPPRDLWPGNFRWRFRKKEARKNRKRGENWEEKKENCKREGGKYGSRKVIKRGEDHFFFLLFTFENDRNLFWVYQNGKFLPGKKHFTSGKNWGKMTLPPQKNIPVMPLELGHSLHPIICDALEQKVP